MFLKRSVDILLSALIVLLLSPVFAAVALAVWLESGSPVMFRQVRIGRGFCRFGILKFRTMRVDAVGPLVTVGGDRRITRVGRILRLTKLDELPQLWNVLLGEMSMVGPRPEVPEYVELFRDRYRTILAVRPGITDLASIYYRNEEAILAQSRDPLHEYSNRILPIKLELADRYIRERSFLRDVAIIARTVIVTLRPNRVSTKA